MLKNPAPVGGIGVNLLSSNTQVATIPRIVIVPARETTATFQVKTNSNPPSGIVVGFRDSTQPTVL